MTLKEKFQEEPVVVYKDSYKLTNQSAELLEQIAEEFAIGFAEWLRGYRYDNAEIYHISSTKELLEIYKKEKGL
jgi:hypothetical protein